MALRVPVTTAVERVESVDDACGSVAEKRVRARREATDNVEEFNLKRPNVIDGYKAFFVPQVDVRGKVKGSHRPILQAEQVDCAREGVAWWRIFSHPCPSTRRGRG